MASATGSQLLRCSGLRRGALWRMPERLPPSAPAPGLPVAQHLPRAALRGLCSDAGPGAPVPQRGGRGSYSEASAAAYAGIDLSEGNFWLMYRHAGEAIRRWLAAPPTAARALDWGCGAGKSSRWLRTTVGIAEVHGADVNGHMLEQARHADSDGVYALAERGRSPFAGGAYDLVLSMCVLIEIPTRDAMSAYAGEAFRMLRGGGIAVAVSATEESHDPANEFLSFRYLPVDPADPHNRQLRSGDRVVCRNNCGLCMEDFFWARQDIVAAFEAAGFQTLEVVRTLGAAGEPFEWRDELRVATDYVFTFRKPEG